MKLLYRLPVLLLLLQAGITAAQLGYDDEVCLDKTPRQVKLEQSKKKLVEGLNKTLIYFSYLNYSDRTVDRVITGVEAFEPYRGKRIRNIDISILAPFGVSIEKPENEHPTKFQKFANGIQMSTKQWVVKNDLLFRVGDKVDPQTFADTERNLWKRETFKDVMIFVTPVDCSDDEVDVTVMVQDRWSWSFITSLQYDKVQAGIEFRNFLGLPHSFTASVAFNYRRDNFYTIFGEYDYRNIKRSQINIRAQGYYSPASKGGELRITRPFFSANAKWAGHLKGGIDKQDQWIPNAFGAAIPTNIFYNWQDVWLATAFKLKQGKVIKNDLTRLILSGRMYRKDYIKRPFMHSEDRSQNFVGTTYVLGSIGIARWDYYLDHSVYYLGQPEYFTKGFNGALIAGFDYDEELNKRFYSGIQLDYGKAFTKFGYMNWRLAYGGFTKQKDYQQILCKLTAQFYSVPIKLGPRFMMRQFVTANLALGFDRPLGKELVVNDANGVRGIFVDYVRGSRSYVFNFETDVYPTFKILGFTSSAFAFADIAITQSGSLSSFQLTQAYGAGIRLRNLGMGIGFFDISFAYYPQLSIPGVKPYAILAGYLNNRSITQQNLFVPAPLKPDY